MSCLRLYASVHGGDWRYGSHRLFTELNPELYKGGMASTRQAAAGNPHRAGTAEGKIHASTGRMGASQAYKHKSTPVNQPGKAMGLWGQSK